ncbi:hypothetical protein HanXRQr2_Chr14g0626581 [Helianthus annuus]|uniref:Uncharacterized protein n=1 Tax=Helianthus annuus TaxID=4232 RepID=A0A9K3E5Z2_HELAN|nr:hypothetical protein HanXRQr2_Chr14g0626581 [Helianthus annuus]KAJ0838984.1 hypothetical protein HanPSC8_Chr14g0601351 [Helianthus annuus]
MFSAFTMVGSGALRNTTIMIHQPFDGLGASGCSHSKFKVEKQFNRYELEMGLVMFSTRRFMHVWEACLPSYKRIGFGVT